MNEIYDSNGTEIGWLHFLVKKSAYDDGSYKLHPEDAWEVDLDCFCAEQIYNESGFRMEVKDLVLKEGYVAVYDFEFDPKALMRAKVARAKRNEERRKILHNKQKREYELREERRAARAKLPWWRRLFS
jgi:hypothetical protein